MQSKEVTGGKEKRKQGADFGPLVSKQSGPEKAVFLAKPQSGMLAKVQVQINTHQTFVVSLKLLQRSLQITPLHVLARALQNQPGRSFCSHDP